MSNSIDRVREKLARLDQMGDWLETADVAAFLDWDSDTIRKHAMRAAEWDELPEEEREGKIPYLKRGKKYSFPSWYVRKWLTLALPPDAR